MAGFFVFFIKLFHRGLYFQIITEDWARDQHTQSQFFQRRSSWWVWKNSFPFSSGFLHLWSHPISLCRPGSICISSLQPQELSNGWWNQSSCHPTISQEPAALWTQEVPQPGLQVCSFFSTIGFLHVEKWKMSASFSSSALSTKWIQLSSRVQLSQMPVPATCWTTVS